MTAAYAVERAAIRREPTPRAYSPEAGDTLALLAGPNGLDLVVELAHDMRSPLSALLALAEVLYSEQAGPLNDTQRQQLALIHGAALGLCTMASDVIELARRSDRSGDGNVTPFWIADVLASVADLCRPMAEEKGLTLRFVNAAGGHRLGHARAISRVLLNLTTNGLKYTERGCVTVAARPTGPGRVEFSVKDTGGGLDADALDGLYAPFRAGAGRQPYHFSSSGLGLAICRKFLRTMGAELRVETWRGRGTRFSFELDLPPIPKLA